MVGRGEGETKEMLIQADAYAHPSESRAFHVALFDLLRPPLFLEVRCKLLTQRRRPVIFR